MKYASPEEACAFSQMPGNHFKALLSNKIFPGKPLDPGRELRAYGARVVGPSALTQDRSGQWERHGHAPVLHGRGRSI